MRIALSAAISFFPACLGAVLLQEVLYPESYFLYVPPSFWAIHYSWPLGLVLAPIFAPAYGLVSCVGAVVARRLFL